MPLSLFFSSSRTIVSSSSTPGSGMDRVISSSLPGASSDCCGESLELMQSGRLIPPQLLLPAGSLQKPSSSFNLTGNGQEGGGGSRDQSFGFVVPEGRVHGGGLMSMLRAGHLGSNINNPES